jgi:hypothetical protein
MSLEVERIRKPPFIVWVAGAVSLYVGFSWWWDYKHLGYVRVPIKSSHGAYVKNEGSFAIVAITVWLVLGTVILALCVRRLCQYRKWRRLNETESSE